MAPDGPIGVRGPEAPGPSGSLVHPGQSSSSGVGRCAGESIRWSMDNPCPSLVSASQKMAGELKTGRVPAVDSDVP